jgi:hypothetical protein
MLVASDPCTGVPLAASITLTVQTAPGQDVGGLQVGGERLQGSCSLGTLNALAGSLSRIPAHAF